MVEKRRKIEQLTLDLSRMQRSSMHQINEIKPRFTCIKEECEQLINAREKIVEILNDTFLKQSQRDWKNWNPSQICNWFKIVLKNANVDGIESISWALVETMLEIKTSCTDYLLKCNEMRLLRLGITEKTHRDILLKMIKRLIDSEEKDLCVICFDDRPDVRLDPCNHVCICRDCIYPFLVSSDNHKCPICRAIFTGVELPAY